MAAILDFRHIGYSDVINFSRFGFPDPENLRFDILQAMFYRSFEEKGGKSRFSRHFVAAILDFRHIGFCDVNSFGKFGFPDPENLGLDILQAMFYHLYEEIG